MKPRHDSVRSLARTSFCTLASLGLSLLIAACGSTQGERKEEAVMDKKIEATPAPVAPGDLAARGHEAFLKTPGLTDAQRIKLSEVMGKTYAQAEKIKMEIGKSKLVLFKTITSPDYNQKDVNILKKKISKLDKDRLELMFKSLDEVQKIIGRNPETAEYLQKIMHEQMKSLETTL